MKKINFILYTIIIILIFPQFTSAYHTETHSYLTKETLDFYNRNVSNDIKISESFYSYVIDGARREDDAPRWMNHFYDPIKNRGLSYDPLIDPSLNFGTWQASKYWTNDEENQNKSTYKVPTALASILTAIQKMKLSELNSETNFTWNRALRFYLRGEKEKAMFTLGHVLHLIQDIDVPAHTRNDPHPEGSPYEDFAGGFTLSSGDLNLSERLDGRNIIILSSLDNYFDELANYSNKNFYSKDTIGVQSGYELPVPDYFSYENSLSYGFKFDQEFGDFPLIRGKGILSLKNEQIFNDDFIASAYWDRLSTKSVQYGAGVIDLFFKEAERLKDDKDFIYQEDQGFFSSLLGSVYNGFTNAGRNLRNLFFGSIGAFNSVITNIFSDLDEDDEDAGHSLKFPFLGGIGNQPDQLLLVPTTTINISTSTEEMATSTENSTSTEEIVLATTTIEMEEETPTSTESGTDDQKQFSIRINEIMYNVLGSDTGKEWIELYHISGDSVDLEDFKLKEGETNHRINYFSGSGVLNYGQYAVLASDPDEFLGYNPGFSGNLFKSAISLSNSGELVELVYDSTTVNSFHYLSSMGADGDGNSLQRFSDGWFPSPSTPGRENFKYVYSGGGGSLPPAGNSLPTAVFSFSPEDPFVGDDIIFSAEGSSDSDGQITQYFWDFGDGNTYSATSTHYAQHAYFESGEKTITLTVYDNVNATSSFSDTLTVSSSTEIVRDATHIVISEILFNPDSGDEGKEFIELYNPLDSTFDLDGWSLRYGVGDSTTTVSIASFGGNEGDIISIPPKGFLLIGLYSYDSSNYSGKLADISRSMSLLNGNDKVSILLRDGDDAVVDEITYSSSSILEDGQSIERKAVLENSCVSPGGDGEFLGNGCDTNRSANFTIRSNPTPQNSSSLPEPRSRPATPLPIPDKTNITEFFSDSLSINFSWNDVLPNVSGASISYKIDEVSTSSANQNVFSGGSTSFSYRVLEVGKNYNFEIIAKDNDGYESLPREETIYVDRLIDVLYVYRDTRDGNEDRYVFDIYYSSFPFIPDIFGRNAWQGIVFYKNREPNRDNLYLDTRDGLMFDDADGIVGIIFPTCAGGYSESSRQSIVFPLSREWCGIGGGLHNSSLQFSELEDNHLLITLSGNYPDISFSPTDYFTVAFYDFSDSGGGRQTLTLVAVDETENFFSETPSTQYPPELNGNLDVEFSDISSSISLILPSVSDRDTLDRNISWESNYSPLGDAFDENLWTSLEISKTVSTDDEFLIGVRAKDDFGNLSEIATTTWTYPTTTTYFSQTQEDGWSDRFGTTLHSSNKPDTASFQSVVAENDFSFDLVTVKLWYEFLSYPPARVRLSVFSDNGSGSPDFSAFLGESFFSISDQDQNQERTFTFDTPISFENGKTYWFVLDVAGYGDGRGYMTNMLKNAVMKGDVYAEGRGGKGFGKGQNADNGMFSFSGDYTFGSADWYIKIGKRL